VIREPAAGAGSRVGGQAGETVLARPLGGDAEPVVGEGEGRVEIDRDAERLLRGDVAARSQLALAGEIALERVERPGGIGGDAGEGTEVDVDGT